MDIHQKINIKSNFPDFKFKVVLPYCKKFIKSHLNYCHYEKPFFK